MRVNVSYIRAGRYEKKFVSWYFLADLWYIYLGIFGLICGIYLCIFLADLRCIYLGIFGLICGIYLCIFWLMCGIYLCIFGLICGIYISWYIFG